MKRNRFVCLVLIYTIFTHIFSPSGRAQETEADSVETKEKARGLEFRLREGTGNPEPNKVLPAAEIGGLSGAEAEAIFRRLPPLDADPSDRTDPAIRPNSLPPPKTGRVIPVKFPAGDRQTAPATETPAALEVVRFSPNGAVPFATDLSVTFSQPMVAVSSPNKTARTVPVELTPAVKGQWRWVGTKTLLFEAAGRFPMATRFTARVPAGTRSATGGGLPEEIAWSFETPPLRVEKFLPDGAMLSHEAVIVAKFNQRIDPESVLPKIIATADGRKIALRLAAPAEIAADEKLSGEIKKLVAGQWIAFRAALPLPADSKIGIEFEAGAPSAEGDLPSAAAQSFSFRTFGPLKLADATCGYERERTKCDSSDDFRLEFNNPLDEQSFDKSLVRIEPKIENAEIAVYGNRIEIGGCCKKARTTYKVEISEALKDEFGQPLGRVVKTEFSTGADDATLYSEAGDNDLITLDPHGRRRFTVNSKNYRDLRIKLFAVTADDYGAFYEYRRGEKKAPPAIGRLVYDRTVKIKSKRDAFAETKIDLAPALSNGLGHVILFVEPPVDPNREDYENIAVWLEATEIGLDAFADYERLTVYASRLKDGKPLKNAGLRLSGGGGEVRTAENGLATLEPAPDDKNVSWLIAQNGADSAVLPNNGNYYNNRAWSGSFEPESLRWFVFDDRKIYRPGETVSIKGYLRRVAGGKLSDVGELGDAVRALSYVLKDPLGNEIARGKADLNIFGAFDFRLKMPETVNLGNETLYFSADTSLENRSFTHQFQVEEFRRPEFEVTAETETAAPFFVGGSATVSVAASYYAGGGLANAETNWKVASEPADYTPPNRDDFTFGKFIPWWNSFSGDDSGETTSQTFKGRTDSSGKHRLALDFVAADPARPFTIKAEARVQDVNRQTFAGSTTLLVHPAELYVGLRTPKTFVEKGEALRVETITTDIDGRAVAGAPVVVIADLKDWEQVKGEWREVTVDLQTCTLKSTSEPAACNFRSNRGGTYTITATVFDKKERRNESALNVWVAGAKSEPGRDVTRETVELIPGKAEYAPGETVEILVNAPFPNAEGILTLRRNGIVRTERFTMTESSTILRIPVEERFLPNFHVRVDLFGAAKRIYFENELDAKLPLRPAFAGGELNLSVSTASRRLNVTAEPAEKTLEPGGETSVSVAVTDHEGRAAAATEVAVVAVDESVLALTNYRIANPLDAFYRELEAGAVDYSSRESLLLADPEDLLTVERGFGFGTGSGMGSGSGSGMGSGDGDGGGLFSPGVRPAVIANTEYSKAKPKTAPGQIRMRRNFDALAIFSPSVKTDANGRAVVKVNLPDNLTRYRITAIAVSGGQKFGRSESAMTARQPLMVRPSAPRFINFGDRAELPVVLQNQTAEALTVDVAIRGTNANLTAGNGRKVTIPAGDRAEIRFPVAAEKAGLARFQIGAVSGALADAAEFAFPVYTPATTEAFATYGTTDQNGPLVQPVAPPENVFPQYGGLEITTSSTQLQELTDAFIYLQNYPFECSEQVSSRILSTAALRDVLLAFKSKEMPAREAIDAKMAAGVERLRKLQHADGGFSFWSSKDESLPYVSVHVAHALARAQAKGYPVPPEMIRKILNYLRTIESKYPPYYGVEINSALSAYALYVRDLMGEKPAEKARKLLREAKIENLSPESLGWLLAVLAGDRDSAAEAATLRRALLDRVTETAGAAHFVTKYKDGEYVLLSSERRADAVILEALLKAENPQSAIPNPKSDDLIPKIVRGLLAGRTGGRWQNTQENAFVLLALDKYFQTYEKATPDFVARVWFGNTFAGEQTFVGRSVDSNSINVPMPLLQKTDAAQNLILDKQGAGRLYYRIGMKYASKELKSEAVEAGFTVTRTYEALDDPGDVRQTADGDWTIRAGARVRVRLQLVAPTRRYHVALVDNLPAGLEIINPDLAVSESVPEDERVPIVGYGFNYYGSVWYDHQNLRDERAEIFKALLYEGVWNYSYTARATTPGNFVAPPARAEEMYAPETFGRSKTDFVEIK
jgi:alpha-2-macroglobulin